MDTTITEASLYRLLTWLSPAYPVGAFGYSHGVEYAVETGLVKDSTGLCAYIAAALESGGGRVDAALLVASWQAARDPARLDEVTEVATAWRGTAEFAHETETQGRAFLATTRAAWPHPGLDAWAERRAASAIALPVAVGAAAAFHGIALPLALHGFVHAFAANLVSCGMRLVPLGQTDGQRALALLEPDVARAAARAIATPLEEITTAAPLLDWCSMRHETQYTRLFRS